MIYLALYVVGWFGASVIATRDWYRHFNETTFSGAVWGMLVGFLWPLAVPALVIREIARRV